METKTTKHSTINWDSPAMRRHGRSIRAKIFEAYRSSFAKAVVMVDLAEKVKTIKETAGSA